jgi:adenylate cyclase
VLWSGQHVSGIEALFTGQDTLVPQIVQQLRQYIAAHELLRVRSLPMSSLASYSLYLGASGLLNSLIQADFVRARDVLEHLIQRHPRQSAPHALLARWHIFLAAQGWSEARERDGLSAAQCARRALDLEPTQAVAHAVLAQIKLNFEADAAASRSHAEQALATDPTEGLAWSQLSAALAFQGEHGLAQHAAEQALAVSPLDPQLYLFESYAAMAAVAGGRFEDAVDLARRSVRHHILHAPSHRLLMAALWLAGRHAEAHAALAQFKIHCPQARAARSAPLRALGGGWREMYEDALLAAGLPD